MSCEACSDGEERCLSIHVDRSGRETGSGWWHKSATPGRAHGTTIVDALRTEAPAFGSAFFVSGIAGAITAAHREPADSRVEARYRDSRVPR